MVGLGKTLSAEHRSCIVLLLMNLLPNSRFFCGTEKRKSHKFSYALPKSAWIMIETFYESVGVGILDLT